MTGTGSPRDAARELLALDVAGDTAPPYIWNGLQEVEAPVQVSI
jgi:hypothetical protein